MRKSIKLFCFVFIASLFLCPSAFATTLTFQCDQGMEITGGRFFDTDSLTMSKTTTYNIAKTGATVTVELGDPEESPGYNFAFLQV